MLEDWSVMSVMVVTLVMLDGLQESGRRTSNRDVTVEGAMQGSPAAAPCR